MSRITTFFDTIIAWIVPTTSKSGDTYFTATSQEDGEALIFRGLKAVPDGVHETKLPNRVIIRWCYEADLDGLPDVEINSAQIALEDALMPLDVNKIGRQVLVVTGNNRKEWCWYVKDFGSWIAQLNQKLATSPTYPIEISHTYEPQWSYYKGFLTDVNGLQAEG